jgi:DDE_Tnp_1-like zinc-ribbon
MGGVDKADQGMAFYSLMRNQQKKYYKKIFRHLLDQCIWNSFVLHKKYSDQRTKHVQFTLDLARQILKKYTKYNSRETLPPNKSQESTKLLRLFGKHFIKYIPQTEKTKYPKRRCVVCYSKKGENDMNVRKETRFYCPTCNVGLCLEDCFETFHTQEKY